MQQYKDKKNERKNASQQITKNTKKSNWRNIALEDTWCTYFLSYTMENVKTLNK